ncbi:hypothetical protein POM88_011032 [Heracleum sosnowskyi]|uniref:Bulb-type lectin domain-containing protein n=1 Tax=Heracleum sosnowskyi TaxID=360622 RepID=A0AAD8IW87_9APIA|nr:hypothetical protein POM88_011032 [Heracleum sosnowskyi]
MRNGFHLKKKWIDLRAYGKADHKLQDIFLLEPWGIMYFADALLVHNIGICRCLKNKPNNGDTIVSANKEFELGFFSPGSCRNWYVGLCFKKISYRTIVWVANRDAPLNNTSGILKIHNKAISLFANATSTKIWSSNSSRFLNNPVAQLLDSGNLMIYFVVKPKP